MFSVIVLVCYLPILNKETYPNSRFDFFIIQYRILIHWKHHEIGPFKPYRPFSSKSYLSLTSYAQRNEISTHRIFSFFSHFGQSYPYMTKLCPVVVPCLMFIKYSCISEGLKKQDKTETARSLRARASEVLECSSILTGGEHYKLKRSQVTTSQASPPNTSAAGQSEGATDSDSSDNWNLWGLSSV